MRKILNFTVEETAITVEAGLFAFLGPDCGASCWSPVNKSPVGTWYIESPTGDERFPEDWRDQIEGVDAGEEINFPAAWIEENLVS